MTKKLEEVFNLPPMEDVEKDIPELVVEPEVEEKSKEEILAEPAKIMNALSNAEKLDSALSAITDLDDHDHEMDDISLKALQSFQDLSDLSNNVPDAHVGRIMEVAATMLKTAMEAKDSKVNRKLKILELQLKKAKLDSDEGNGQHSGTSNGIEFDRNELLKRITDSINPAENKDKK